MKIKTSELTRAALDWAVAKCEGLRCGVITPADVLARRSQSLTEDEMSELSIPTESVLHLLDHDVHAGYSPSTNWSQGGPIIEREAITVSKEAGCWSAYFRDNLFEDDGSEHWQTGPTPLIAAMRCYVASNLGDEVEIPEELT